MLLCASQAMAVHSAVLNGWKEMPEMTHADTLGMARTFDIIRAQAAAKAPVAATLEQVPPSRYPGHESVSQTELVCVLTWRCSHMCKATAINIEPLNVLCVRCGAENIEWPWRAG